MSIAQQAKAARRKARQDLRWHARTSEGIYIAKKGRRAAGYTSASAKDAAARGRKRVQMGGRSGSIGFGYK